MRLRSDITDLASDMVKVSSKGKYSDFTLVCGESRIPVHRSILAERSKVFAAIFQKDMSEGKTGMLIIEDVDPTTMKMVVKYLYAGTIERFKDVVLAMKLYEAAEKYAVSQLKRIATLSIMDNLAENVVCDVLLMAEKFGDELLQEAAREFAAQKKDVSL